MLKKIFFLLLLQIIVFSSFSQKSDTSIIVLMHTNDMHGYIDDYAKMKPIIDSIRRENTNTLLLSAGDLFSGNPVVDKYPDKGFAMIDLMNKMGYDLTCVGNHEFDYGQEILKKRISQANFSFICANVYKGNSELEDFEPYKIFNFLGTRIAFVSVLDITKDGYPETLIDNLVGLGFSNPYDELKQYQFLKDSANIVVALTHLGYKNDKIVQKKDKYVDLIIGGHSHTFIEPYTDRIKRPIFQVGNYNEYLGEIKLFIVDNKIVKIENKIFDIKSLNKKDSSIEKLVDKYNNNPALNTVVANFDTAIADKQDLAILMANSYMDTLKTDFAVMNYGGVRIDSLSKGFITKKDIYSLDPFNNELYIGKLTLAEIKSFVKSSYKKEGKLKVKIIGLPKFTYTWNKKKVKEIYFTNNLGINIDDDKEYTIVISSYVATKYNFDGKEKLKPSGIYSNDAIFNYLKKNFN